MNLSFYRRLMKKFQPQRFAPGRRDFLRASAAAAAGLMLSNCGIEEGLPGMARRIFKKVIVVGGGFSGLACAYELASRGYFVTVLEARNRIGGRVVSVTEGGKVIEGGGELVGSEECHPLWHAYAKKFGLTFNEIPDTDEQLMFDGKILSEEEAKKLHDEMDAAANLLNEQAEKINADEPWNSPGAAEMDAHSMAQWLASVQGSPVLKRAVRAWFEADETVALERQSYLAFLTMIKGGGVELFWSDAETCRCAQGNQALAKKLAEHVEVRLNAPVKAISYGSDGVMVTLPNEEHLRADDVVFTLAPSVWSDVNFTPALPPELAIQMGVGVKYLAPVKKVYWDEKRGTDSLSDTEISMTWHATEGQAGEGAVLNCFAGGPPAAAFRARSAESRRAYAAEHLNKLLPGYTENALPNTRFMDWPGDPLTRASYSFAAPGQIMAAGKRLRDGFARLHFAGEHTCFKFCGYMEGALHSGVSVARKLAKRDGAA